MVSKSFIIIDLCNYRNQGETVSKTENATKAPPKCKQNSQRPIYPNCNTSPNAMMFVIRLSVVWFYVLGKSMVLNSGILSSIADQSGGWFA